MKNSKKKFRTQCWHHWISPLKSYFHGLHVFNPNILLLVCYCYVMIQIEEGKILQPAYPKHLPQVRVPETEGDVGHMEAFGGPLVVWIDPRGPSTASSPWANSWLTINLGGPIWLLGQRVREERGRERNRRWGEEKILWCLAGIMQYPLDFNNYFHSFTD